MLLGHVVGEVAVPDNYGSEAVDPPLVAAHERDGSIVVAGRQSCPQGFVGRAQHTVNRSDGLPRIARNPDDPAARISCRVIERQEST